MRVLDLSKELDKLKAFYDSLDEEKKTFTLPWTLLEKAIIVVVEEDKGRIIGISGIRDNYFAFTCIEKQFQGKGIGTKLIKERNKIVKKNRIGILYATTHKNNIIAQRLLEKSGYNLVKIEEDIYHYKLYITMKAKLLKFLSKWANKIGLKT
ncbi:GNAT family N-acetyltransferase [Candidatus Borrarchaeum sp.]|uniref:GNAT family N-acetyltransferase n=1 Tax=Candidatus Borrarchaeum sp. TaxID=2846742 RepID=UPI00257D1021|nr:GNAT family N-acetyltransferase [Candidatus Borrarchaeum sp.]